MTYFFFKRINHSSNRTFLAALKLSCNNLFTEFLSLKLIIDCYGRQLFISFSICLNLSVPQIPFLDSYKTPLKKSGTVFESTKGSALNTKFEGIRISKCLKDFSSMKILEIKNSRVD